MVELKLNVADLVKNRNNIPNTFTEEHLKHGLKCHNKIMAFNNDLTSHIEQLLFLMFTSK